MSEKFTPGPWELTHTEHMGYRVSDSTGWGVAIVLKDVNDKANAHLIAAAPEMYEIWQILNPAQLLSAKESKYQNKRLSQRKDSFQYPFFRIRLLCLRCL